ncbi:MAG: hypothetical protein OQK98_04565 [Gammaproteobacteria bacterium]|nr:hypothetical protein [Gammaproteobacteria bacterium]
MSTKTSINITLDADKLKDFCQQLLKRSRDISKTHDALITLETFISVFARPAHGTVEYKIIEDTINEITEISRQQLLKKSTTDLISALRLCDAKSITSIHTPLSRNGFYQILQTSIEKLSDDDIRLVMLWSDNWVKEAAEMAEEASAYPDSMNFNNAGITIEEFQAISDIDRVLNPK